MVVKNFGHHTWRPSPQLNYPQYQRTTTQTEWGLPQGLQYSHSQGDLTSRFTPTLQALIEEMAASMQASPTMIATLLLGAIAAAAQGLYDVQRPNCNPTPTSLLCAAFQVSGGRKSSAMDALLQPHIEFQRKINREWEDDSDYEADRLAWQARRKACEAALRKNYDDAEKVGTLTQKLKGIMREEPKKRRRATNIIMRNTTIEALTQGMHTNSPSAAITSDEASAFFRDNRRYLTNFNQGNDGADIKVDRVTGGTYFVEQPRLSLILAAQPRPIKKLIDEHGADWIEIGFLPRMLVALCTQDIGIRINQRIVSRDGRNKYQARMQTLLDVYGEKLKAGDMSRIALTFTLEAQAQLEQTRQWLESESINNGQLSNIREYAARCPEHIARIAANLHVAEEYAGTQISLDTVLHSTLIVRWYAQEYQDLFGDLHMPLHERDAKSILNFLWGRYQQSRNEQFNIRWLAQHTWGGRELRSSMSRVNAAIDFLESMEIVHRLSYGRRCDICLDHQYIEMRWNQLTDRFRAV